MNTRIAGVALALAALGLTGANAQSQDPWGGSAPVDPYQVPQPDPSGPQSVDPYQISPDGSFITPPATDPFADPAPARAQAPRIENRVAAFSGLDKITGRLTSFTVSVDETVQFGALQVTPRACYSAPPEETPKTDTFVEIDEVTLDRDIRRIFTGWMFADSPGLNAVEHPVYDVWLVECRSDETPSTTAG